MIAADLPDNEQERRSALRRCDILDSEAENDFDRITAQIAGICQTPIAVVSLIDADRQWFKSHHGLDVSETPRDVAFCSHAILEPDRVMTVPDATADERFFDNPLVTGSTDVRFYAGVPLVTSDGYALGTLCVLDTECRELNAQQLQALRRAGRTVTNLIEARETIAGLERMNLRRRETDIELQAEIERDARGERELSSIATRDPLTRLPLRADFVARLDDAFNRLCAGGKRFAVCFVEIDGFAEIKDELGQHVADALLVEVGRRLADVIRGGDVIARVGGEKFALLIDGATSANTANALSERIAAVLSTKLRLADLNVSVTGCVGIALVDSTYTLALEVMRDAELALAASQQCGRNQSTLFTATLRGQLAIS